MIYIAAYFADSAAECLNKTSLCENFSMCNKIILVADHGSLWSFFPVSSSSVLPDVSGSVFSCTSDARFSVLVLLLFVLSASEEFVGSFFFFKMKMRAKIRAEAEKRRDKSPIHSGRLF